MHFRLASLQAAEITSQWIKIDSHKMYLMSHLTPISQLQYLFVSLEQMKLHTSYLINRDFGKYLPIPYHMMPCARTPLADNKSLCQT